MIIKTAQPINNAFIIKAINEKLSENPRCHYVIAIEDYDKLAAIRWAA